MAVVQVFTCISSLVPPTNTYVRPHTEPIRHGLGWGPLRELDVEVDAEVRCCAQHQTVEQKEIDPLIKAALPQGDPLPA